MKRERLPNPPECKKVKHQLVFLLRLSRIRTCHLFLVRIKNENMKHQAFSTVPRTGSQPMKGIHKSQSSRGELGYTHTHKHIRLHIFMKRDLTARSQWSKVLHCATIAHRLALIFGYCQSQLVNTNLLKFVLFQAA